MFKGYLRFPILDPDADLRWIIAEARDAFIEAITQQGFSLDGDMQHEITHGEKPMITIRANARHNGSTPATVLLMSDGEAA